MESGIKEEGRGGETEQEEMDMNAPMRKCDEG